MRTSADSNPGTEALKPAQGLKRAWSVPTITDEDASLTAAKPFVQPTENSSPTTPAGPS
jgi:hypothetical protein